MTDGWNVPYGRMEGGGAGEKSEGHQLACWGKRVDSLIFGAAGGSENLDINQSMSGSNSLSDIQQRHMQRIMYSRTKETPSGMTDCTLSHNPPLCFE